MLQIICQDKSLKQLVAKQFLESAESFIPLLSAWHLKTNIYLFSQELKIGAMQNLHGSVGTILTDRKIQ